MIERHLWMSLDGQGVGVDAPSLLLSDGGDAGKLLQTVREDLDVGDGFPRSVHAQHVYLLDDKDDASRSLLRVLHESPVECLWEILSRNAVRESFKLIDFTSDHSDTLKALILRSVAVPQVINHTHGKRLLSM